LPTSRRKCLRWQIKYEPRLNPILNFNVNSGTGDNKATSLVRFGGDYGEDSGDYGDGGGGDGDGDYSDQRSGAPDHSHYVDGSRGDAAHLPLNG
jgi:hypothetical protein